MQKVTACQRIAIARIACQDVTAESGLSIECRAALEHYDWLARHAPYGRMTRISQLDTQQRAGAIELVIIQTLQHIRNREREALNGHQRRVVESDQSAAAADEIAQLRAALPDTPDVFARDRPRR